MNKDYLPFYNSLNDKDKAFWMECTKEELIDHLISNIRNGEELLSRIDKGIEYVNNTDKLKIVESDVGLRVYYFNKEEMLNILKGGNKNC